MKDNKKSSVDGLTNQERKEAWEKGYAKDLPIIGGFLEDIIAKLDKSFRLYFADGTQLLARFITCGDSDKGSLSI